MRSEWTYHNPVNITCGPGILSRLSGIVPPKGILLLVTTPGFTHRGMTDRVIQMLGPRRVTVHDQIAPNPDLDDLDLATQKYKPYKITDIIALGGGSVLDTAKVLGVSLASPRDTPLDAMLRRNQKDEGIESIPVIAVPTTSGTGAEVTPFATVWDVVNRKKHSLSGKKIYPSQALLDPKLTLTLPYRETMYTGLDAVSHALESLWNKNRTPVSESFALHALSLANQALPIVLENPEDLENRAKMQQAALLAGLAISRTKTAIAHAVSYPVTIHHGVPHGLACSFTLVGLIELYFPTVGNECEKNVLKNTLETLRSLKIKDEMARYTDCKKLLDHIDEMFHPDRAGNFSIGLHKENIINILKSF